MAWGESRGGCLSPARVRCVVRRGACCLRARFRGAPLCCRCAVVVARVCCEKRGGAGLLYVDVLCRPGSHGWCTFFLTY